MPPARVIERPSTRRLKAKQPIPHDRTPGDIMGYSEEHFRFFAELLPHIVWTGLPNGYIDFMNKRWFEFTGLTERDTYEELKTAVHPDDFLRYKRKWAEAVRTKKPYEVQYRFRRASDGMYRWHLGRGIPLYDNNGKIIKWFGTCTDIHAQKEAEEQVRRLNEQLESLVLERTAHLLEEVRQRRKAERQYREHVLLLQRMINTLPMAAVAADQDGVILYANEPFRSLFAPDVDMEALVGHPCVDVLGVIRDQLPSPTWEQFRRHFADPMSGGFHEELSLADGRTLGIERISGLEGAESGYLLLVRDVSEAKRIDAVKSNFMSLASHQLRTPLTSIRWALGRLDKQLEGQIDPAHLELLQKAKQSTITMAQTITTMLSISRVEAGLHSVKATAFSLAEFLEGVRKNFADACAHKNISLVAACLPDIQLKTDREVLREILENLLSNAVKYTPTGGSIVVRCSREGDRVLLRVQDTGYGIPMHQHEKVFTKFFRGENITHVDTHGTGLGLYLSSLLVQAIGGSVDFTSEQGRGTTFVLTLPNRT